MSLPLLYRNYRIFVSYEARLRTAPSFFSVVSKGKLLCNMGLSQFYPAFFVLLYNTIYVLVLELTGSPRYAPYPE